MMVTKVPVAQMMLGMTSHGFDSPGMYKMHHFGYAKNRNVSILLSCVKIWMFPAKILLLYFGLNHAFPLSHSRKMLKTKFLKTKITNHIRYICPLYTAGKLIQQLHLISCLYRKQWGHGRSVHRFPPGLWFLQRLASSLSFLMWLIIF